ncbi:MAG: keto-deoxy-phosphogluconate aldolase [Blastococcus sp.]|jgi:2-dehydro-3-deoxyphosphogluconate aldolase/(4S)-4-hydroxy-2-oxoglutarate aldolase|nr:keto-deoxy-phosphogluconate aldolase [Blastococcus sp.]
MTGTDTVSGAVAETSPDDPVATIAATRLLPVLVVHDPKHAKPLADALRTGGLPCAEVTFRTDCAVEVLRIMADQPGLAVGAGTILNAAQAQEAVEAGARYIVTPSLNLEVLRACQDMGVPVFPGVVTPTELQTALDAGARTVKFFPAQAMGGVTTVKALAAPFPMARFIPTGGINEANVADYLAQPAVFAVGGSWMASPDLLREERFDEITRLSRVAVARAHNTRPAP